MAACVRDGLEFAQSTVADMAFLHELAKGAYGIAGKARLVTGKASGGNAALVHTTSAARLLPALAGLSGLCPLSLLLVHLLRGHTDRYKEGGLFALLVASSLVKACLRLVRLSGHHHQQVAVPHAAISWVYHALARESKAFLQSAACPCGLRPAAWRDDDTLLTAVASTVIAPRSACRLSPEEVGLVSERVVAAFNLVEGRAHPHTQHRVTTRCVHGPSACQAVLLPGVVVELGPDNVRYVKQSIAGSGQRRHLQRPSAPVCVTAVFTESLAGDIAPWAASGVLVEDDDEVFQEMGLRRLRAVCARLVATKVDLVVCQRVIHPSVRELLWAEGISTIDRFSLQHIDTLLRLSGASPLPVDDPTLAAQGPHAGGHAPPYEHAHLARLDPPATKVLFGRCYIHLTAAATDDHRPSQGSPVGAGSAPQPLPAASLILCAADELAGADLLAAVEGALGAMDEFVACPWVLAGAGATESLLATHLRDWSQRTFPQMLAAGPGARDADADDDDSDDDDDGDDSELAPPRCSLAVAKRLAETFCHALESGYSGAVEGVPIRDILLAANKKHAAPPPPASSVHHGCDRAWYTSRYAKATDACPHAASGRHTCVFGWNAVARRPVCVMPPPPPPPPGRAAAQAACPVPGSASVAACVLDVGTAKMSAVESAVAAALAVLHVQTEVLYRI